MGKVVSLAERAGAPGVARLAALADELVELPPEQIAAALGELARLEALLKARLLRESAAPARSEPPAEADRVLAANPAAPVRSQEAGGLLTQREGAAFLGVSPRTLEGWRVRGGGPRFVRLGRAVRYRRADLEEYMHERTWRSTSEDATAQIAGQRP